MNAPVAAVIETNAGVSDEDLWDDSVTAAVALSYQQFSRQARAFAAASSQTSQEYSCFRARLLDSNARCPHSFLPIRNPHENLLLPTTPQQPRSSLQVWEWISARNTNIHFTLGSGGYLRLRNVRVKALQLAGGDARPIDEDSSSHFPDALDGLEEESVAVDDPSALLCSGNFRLYSDLPARPLSCSAA